MAAERRSGAERDELIIAACEAFVKKDEDTVLQDIADRLTEAFHTRFTREQVYPLIREGVKRGFLLLAAPPHEQLEQRLLDRYGRGDDPAGGDSIRVVATRGQAANEQVSMAGAQMVLELLREVGQRKKGPVHLGLGSGWTTMQMARRLAQLLRGETELPGLVLHALSSGFDVTDPLRAPVAFFGLFQDLPVKVEYVGLFVSATVAWGDYERVKRQPGVRESFERAAEIDIVVTSLASAGDEHGALNRFLELWSKQALGGLRREGWVGDVLYLPYSVKGPIGTGSGVRAVTLFELSDLVAMAKRKDKYVVLLGGPCGDPHCAKPKTAALRPLLKEPRLRVWTHLVIDAGTASELLQPAGAP